MPSFELIVVGAGGGPLETNLSAYLFKEYDADWESGIVGLEAGSGFGALTSLLTSNPDLFGPLGRASRPSLAAARVLNHIHTYLVSHAHMDHIMGLVLTAGATHGVRKKIVATKPILKYIGTVFGEKLWPNLASWKPEDPAFRYLLSPIDIEGKYHPIAPNISVRPMPLSHGKMADDSHYPSLAYFVRHDSTEQQFLFFGDVEPDSISGSNTTREVWKAAAPLILKRKLNTIFLECSWQADRPDSQLYGHLSPKHFIQELRALASELVLCQEANPAAVRSHSQHDDQPPLKRRKSVANSLKQPLKGIKVYVIHFKEPMEDTEDPRPIHEIITSEIKELAKQADLGVEIVAAEQGMRLLI